MEAVCTVLGVGNYILERLQGYNCPNPFLQYFFPKLVGKQKVLPMCPLLLWTSKVAIRKTNEEKKTSFFLIIQSFFYEMVYSKIASICLQGTFWCKWWAFISLYSVWFGDQRRWLVPRVKGLHCDSSPPRGRSHHYGPTGANHRVWKT
jgi:hypothetical protein